MPRWFLTALAALGFFFVFGGTAFAVTGDDTPTLSRRAAEGGRRGSRSSAAQLDLATTSSRLAGDNPLDISQAGALRAHAANAARKLAKNAPGTGPHLRGSWSSLGPNPIVTAARSDNAFYALSGRIGALAIRPWNGEYHPRRRPGRHLDVRRTPGHLDASHDDQDTQTIGALAVAPSNDRSSTPAPARARSRATACTATAS